MGNVPSSMYDNPYDYGYPYGGYGYNNYAYNDPVNI
jgi:hypothetical protein